MRAITAFTKTPERYLLAADLFTTSCAGVNMELKGSIGSFGPSGIGLRLDPADLAVAAEHDCHIESFELHSDPPLQMQSSANNEHLVSIELVDRNGAMHLENVAKPPEGGLMNVTLLTASVSDGILKPTDSAAAFERGLSIRPSLSPDNVQSQISKSAAAYKLTFSPRWQPANIIFSFELPESVKTYFRIHGSQFHLNENQVESREAQRTDLDVVMSFRTDDVSVVRGSVSDSGDARSIRGALRFGIENADAESRRESASVTYSAILGIGIALLTEAFVILLAIAVLAIAATDSKSRAPTKTQR